MRGAIRLVGWLVLLASTVALAQEGKTFTRTRDVIYGRKDGVALTMDVFTPTKSNGYGVVMVVSGGWFSRVESINTGFFTELLKRGYTVFAVVHGSQPKFTLPEIAQDMHRSIRFIRFYAKKYGIDPNYLGIMGASAGGHLSLLMGTSGKPGDPKAKDPVDRESSAVQAVACFFPPTDFLNWGEKGKEMIDRQFQPPFTATFDYHEYDKKRALFLPVKDKKTLREMTAAVSPITHLSKDSAPALIIHGDKDRLVPIQQAEVYIEKSKDVGAVAKLVVRKGADHGWLTILNDINLFADWFDVHLRKMKAPE